MSIRHICGFILGTFFVLCLVTQPTDGATLIAHWPLDQDEGEEVEDVIGDHHGQLQGGDAEWVPGRFGNGLRLEGPNQYVEVPKTEALELETLTLIAWVNIQAPGARQEVVSYSDNYAIFAESAFRGVLFNGGGWSVANGTTAIQAETWYQAGLVIDEGEIRLYVNGQLDASLATPPIAYQDFPLWFGGGPADNQFWLTGILDEIEIWDGPLTDAEIGALFDAPPLAVDSSSDKLTAIWGELKRRR